MEKAGNNRATQCKMLQWGLNSLACMHLRIWGPLKIILKIKAKRLLYSGNFYTCLRYFYNRKVFIFLFPQNNYEQHQWNAPLWTHQLREGGAARHALLCHQKSTFCCLTHTYQRLCWHHSYETVLPLHCLISSPQDGCVHRTQISLKVNSWRDW